MKWLLNETYSPLIQTENNNNLTSLKTNLMHSFRKTGKLRHKLSGQKLCLMFHIVFSVFLLSFSHSLARTLHASVQLNFNAQSCLFVVHFIYIFFFVRFFCCAFLISVFSLLPTKNVQNRKIPRCLFEINNTYCW